MYYTDQTLIEDFLQRDLTEAEIGYLSILNPTLKDWIDKHLGSRFDSVDSTTRYFEACGNTIDLDPCTNVSSITAVDQYQTSLYAYQTWEYVLEPINHPVKRELRLRGARRSWPHGTENIAVMAQFSEYYGKIPEDIRLAATHIAGNIMSVASFSSDIISSESIEGHSLTYRDPNANIESIAQSDPLVKSVMNQRQELLVW